MESPIYSAQDSDTGILFSVFPHFARASTATGGILAEYGAAHIRRVADPPGAVVLDRYGDMRASARLPIPLGVAPDMDGGAFLAAVLAMRRASVAHMQIDDNGCGAAVAAHILRISYADALRRLYPDGRARITGTQRLARAIRASRHVCKSQTWTETMEHGAIAVLIKNADPRAVAHYGHYVAIAPGGKIIDPELVLPYPLPEYPRRGWKVLACFTRPRS